MKQICKKKKYPSTHLCCKELSNPRCLTVSVNLAESCLQTTERQLGLDSWLRYERGGCILLSLLPCCVCVDVTLHLVNTAKIYLLVSLRFEKKKNRL